MIIQQQQQQTTTLTILQATHIQEMYIKQILLTRTFQSKIRLRSHPIRIIQLFDFYGKR
eukprot:UN10113